MDGFTIYIEEDLSNPYLGAKYLDQMLKVMKRKDKHTITNYKNMAGRFNPRVIRDLQRGIVENARQQVVTAIEAEVAILSFFNEGTDFVLTIDEVSKGIMALLSPFCHLSRSAWSRELTY